MPAIGLSISNLSDISLGYFAIFYYLKTQNNTTITEISNTDRNL
jgi:hypothetical protein